MFYRKSPEPKSWFHELVLLNGAVMVVTSANLMIMEGLTFLNYVGLMMGVSCFIYVGYSGKKVNH